MNSLKTYLTIVCLFVISTFYSKDIYVAKAVKIQTPYLTVSMASSVAIAGDVIYIKEGTYEEILSLTNSGTAGSPIVFQTYLGHRVIISAIQALLGWTKKMQGQFIK